MILYSSWPAVSRMSFGESGGGSAGEWSPPFVLFLSFWRGGWYEHVDFVSDGDLLAIGVFDGWIIFLHEVVLGELDGEGRFAHSWRVHKKGGVREWSSNNEERGRALPPSPSTTSLNMAIVVSPLFTEGAPGYCNDFIFGEIISWRHWLYILRLYCGLILLWVVPEEGEN